MHVSKLGTILLGAGSLACAATTSSQLKPPATPSFNWEAEVDFTQLRNDYAARSDFSTLCEDERPDAAEKIDKAIGQSNWDAAAELSDRWLASCPVDAQIHLWNGAVLAELGRPEQSKTHFRWFKGLTDSVLATGDGKTPETAYVTISIPEEYATLLALRLRPVSQALVSEPLVDAITVEDENRRQSAVFFNPAAHFIRLQKKLEAFQ